jgi:hypothetical protein
MPLPGDDLAPSPLPRTIHAVLFVLYFASLHPWLMTRDVTEAEQRMALPSNKAANEARGAVSKRTRGYRVLPFGRNRQTVV